jgi:hypothetical protein
MRLYLVSLAVERVHCGTWSTMDQLQGMKHGLSSWKIHLLPCLDDGLNKEQLYRSTARTDFSTSHVDDVRYSVRRAFLICSSYVVLNQCVFPINEIIQQKDSHMKSKVRYSNLMMLLDPLGSWCFEDAAGLHFMSRGGHSWYFRACAVNSYFSSSRPMAQLPCPTFANGTLFVALTNLTNSSCVYSQRLGKRNLSGKSMTSQSTSSGTNRALQASS